MLKQIKAIKNWNSATWNRIKIVGPFLISQSEKMSEAWQDHERRLAAVRIEEEAGVSKIKIHEQSRLAEVEIFKNAASVEMEARWKVRGSLLARIVDAEPEDRMELERKIEYLDGTARILGIGIKSADYHDVGSADPEREINEHWIDSFNAFARRRNEIWRAELLARALAKEAESPGSVSPRALWAIGNLDEKSFERFSEFLDLCVWPLGGASAFIPDTSVQADSRITKSGTPAGVLVFLLGDLGLLAAGSCFKPFRTDTPYVFHHGADAVELKAKRDFNSSGRLLSPLGASIACFYERDWNSSGKAVLNEWIDFLNPGDVEKSRFEIKGEIPSAQNV